MKIIIRKLLPDDINAYHKLRLQCLKMYPMHFTANYEDEKAKEKLFFHNYIKQADINNFILGAFIDTTLVGFSGFNRYERLKVNHKGRIIQVYVSLDYQGQKIGFNLVKSTVEEAFKLEGIEQIEIDAIASNTNAEHLYKKLGFVEYGIQKHFLKVDGMYYDLRMMLIFKSCYNSLI